MSNLSLFLNPQIREYAKKNNVVFTSDEIERINSDVSGIASVDENNGLRFDLAGGSVQTIDAAIGAMSVGLGKSAPHTQKSGASAPTLPAGGNSTARALAVNAARREGMTAARAVEAQALVDEHGNPWDPRSINRTRQALVTNLDPALATRLRRQAGGR